MANFTGANVITASDVTKYQPDVFDFGIYFLEDSYYQH
jgi:hypothetical protein